MLLLVYIGTSWHNDLSNADILQHYLLNVPLGQIKCVYSPRRILTSTVTRSTSYSCSRYEYLHLLRCQQGHSEGYKALIPPYYNYRVLCLMFNTLNAGNSYWSTVFLPRTTYFVPVQLQYMYYLWCVFKWLYNIDIVNVSKNFPFAVYCKSYCIILSIPPVFSHCFSIAHGMSMGHQLNNAER